MATKKAKKTTKNKASAKPTVKATVISAGTTKKPTIKSYFSGLNKINDIDGIFSAKTLSLLAVEMIGTMILAIVYSYTKINAFFIMLTIIPLIVTFSGFAIAGFNPIFSIGSWLTKKISTKKMVLTVIAQILGVMLAVILLSTFIKAAPELTAEMKAYGQKAPTIFKIVEVAKDKELYVFGAELLGSAIVGFMVAQALKRQSIEKAFIFGGGFYAAMTVANSAGIISESHNLLNPAMSIAAIDFTKDNWQWNTVIYIIAPILGGVIGYEINMLLVKPSEVKTSITRQ